MAAVIHSQDWDASELQQFQDALGPPDFALRFLRGVEGERALCLDELQHRPHRELWAFLQSPLSPRPGSLLDLDRPYRREEWWPFAREAASRLWASLQARVLFPIWRFGWGHQATTDYLAFMDEILRAQRQAVGRKSMAVLQALHPATPRPRSSGVGLLRSFYADKVIHSIDHAMIKALRQDTERALLHAELALLRFMRSHGHWPEHLDELMPEFLPAIPIDAMDGQPLRYRRQDNGAFLLWSLGEDLTDDSGDTSAPSEAPRLPHIWAGPDAAWPQSATAEEVVRHNRRLEESP